MSQNRFLATVSPPVNIKQIADLDINGKIPIDGMGYVKFIIADINNDEPFKSEVYDNVMCEKCPYFFLCK